MSPQEPTAPPLPEELEAEELIHRANALLERHRPGFRTNRARQPEDDLPILTEVFELPQKPDAPDNAGESHPNQKEQLLAEQLIDLETVIGRTLENWFRSELPPIIAREIERLNHRIREEAIGHLRTTLLPLISETISEHLSDENKHE